MNLLPQAFKAHHAPLLADKPLQSAYVFGAASKLGEAVLNQVLANPKYTRVYVSTCAPLPATIAHLSAIQSSRFESDFELQDAAQTIDCFFIVQPSHEPVLNGVHGVSSRKNVFEPLFSNEVTQMLGMMGLAMIKKTVNRSRWCLISTEAPKAQLADMLESYASTSECLVYGLAQGEQALKTPYLFTALGTGLLDRVGVWVLNILANTMRQMVSSKSNVPLTNIKVAQRLMQQFDLLDGIERKMLLLSREDLR